jgi:hypothetical protein
LDPEREGLYAGECRGGRGIGWGEQGGRGKRGRGVAQFRVIRGVAQFREIRV